LGRFMSLNPKRESEALEFDLHFLGLFSWFVGMVINNRGKN